MQPHLYCHTYQGSRRYPHQVGAQSIHLAGQKEETVALNRTDSETIFLCRTREP